VLFAAALGRRLSGSTAIGLAAGAAVALSPSVLYFASEGLTEIPFVAAEVAAFVLLWDLPQRARAGRAAFALGLVLGIAHLIRPVMVPLLPAWLIGVALARRDSAPLRAIAYTLAGFLVCAVPLALYKLIAAGNPLADVAKYNLLTWLSPELTPERIHRMIHPPAPGPYLVAHFGAVLAKLGHFGPTMAWRALMQAGSVTGLLAFVYLAWSGRVPETRPLRVTLIVLAVTFVTLVTLSLPNERYLFPLLPLAIVIGVVAARDLVHRLPLSPATAGLVMFAVIALGPRARHAEALAGGVAARRLGSRRLQRAGVARARSRPDAETPRACDRRDRHRSAARVVRGARGRAHTEHAGGAAGDRALRAARCDRAHESLADRHAGQRGVAFAVLREPRARGLDARRQRYGRTSARSRLPARRALTHADGRSRSRRLLPNRRTPAQLTHSFLDPPWGRS
jgi:hypothetical protein